MEGFNIGSRATEKKARTARSKQGGRSFEGITVVSSKPRRGTKAVSVNNQQFKNDKQIKNARRRKSLDMFTMNKQIRNSIRNSAEASMLGALDGIIFEGTPMERLETVMTKAKESGLSADKIFSFFKGGEKLDRNVRLSKQEFLTGLEKVGEGVFVLSEKELDELVEKFDTDSDGMISFDEFRTYCLFQIPSLAWRAERQRMEKSGEMERLKARLSSRLSQLAKFKLPCGEEFCSTSKLFWRTKANIRIHMFYCEPMDIITVQLCLENSDEEMLPIYVRKRDCMIKKTELEEVITTAVQTSAARTDEQKVELKKKTELDFYAKYLVTRIQLKESRRVAPTNGTPLGNTETTTDTSYVPYLSKLSGDDCQTVMIQKPKNLAAPPPLKNLCVTEFQEVADSFKKEARSARSSRQSAQDMSSLVGSALSEVASELSLDKLNLDGL